MRVCDIKSIAEVMGHKNIELTIRNSLPTPEHKRRAVGSLDRGTTIFTTPPKTLEETKFVNIGNY
jgi:hypothetical protein